MLRLLCPGCRKTLGLDDAFAGSVCRCANCGQVFRAPSQPGSAPASPAPAEAAISSAPPIRRPPYKQPIADVYAVASDELPTVLSAHPATDRDHFEPSWSAPPNEPGVLRRRRSQSFLDDLGRWPEDIGTFANLVRALAIVAVLSSLALAPVFAWAALLLLIEGALLGFFGWLWFLTVAWEEAEIWPVMLIPFYALFFLLRYFERAAPPFLLQLFGGGLVVAAVVLGALYPLSEADVGTSNGSVAQGELGNRGDFRPSPFRVDPPVPREAGPLAPDVPQPRFVPDPLPVKPPARQEAPAPAHAFKTPPPATEIRGLLGYWAFDDHEGNRTPDRSGQGNDAVLHGGDWVEGVRGKAIRLAGASYLDYGSAGSFDFPRGGDFTIACWLKTDAGSGTVLSQRNSREEGAVIDITIDGGRLAALVRQDGNAFGQDARVTGSVVNDGAWHHLALTRDEGNAIGLWIDGRLQAAGTGPDAGGSITTNLRTLGLERFWTEVKFGPGNPHFEGCLDEFCIFRRQLERAEIKKLAGQ